MTRSNRALLPLLPLLLLVALAGLPAGCGGGDSEESSKPIVTFKPGGTGNGGNGNGGTQVPDISGTGTITGSIKLIGTAPTPRIIVPKGTAERDGNICAAARDIVEESLVVGSNGGIANVFVYIDKTPPGSVIPPVPADPDVFDQSGCVFTPHAKVFWTNREIRIKSLDDLAHNTHTYPIRSRQFNQAISAKDRVGVAMKYNRHEHEPFPVKCDFHKWMSAYHLALPHPWGTVTDENGGFRLTGVPATTVTLSIWHERAGGKGGYLEKSLTIEVKDGEDITRDLTFELSKFGL